MNPVRLMTAATLIGLPAVFGGARAFPLRWERLAVCLVIPLLSFVWLAVIADADSSDESPPAADDAAGIDPSSGRVLGGP
jgi:hypothetical protein